MTYEEARYWVNHNGATYQQESESLELVNKAVDKQIALAPIQVNKCTYWRCSSCGNDVGDSKYHLNYCGGCGQKQDWTQVKYWNQ